MLLPEPAQSLLNTQTVYFVYTVYIVYTYFIMCDDCINKYYYYSNEQVYMGHKVTKVTGLLLQIIKFSEQDFYIIGYFYTAVPLILQCSSINMCIFHILTSHHEGSWFDNSPFLHVCIFFLCLFKFIFGDPGFLPHSKDKSGGLTPDCTQFSFESLFLSAASESGDTDVVWGKMGAHFFK